MSRRKRKSSPAAPAASFADQPRKNLPARSTALIANTRNDITSPYFSGTLQHADNTLIQQASRRMNSTTTPQRCAHLSGS